jgi:tRNA(His) guanylyltransferase
LFTQFGINYNTLPAMFRKGSILVREEAPEAGPSRQSITQPDSAGVESRAAVDDGSGADAIEEGVAALELSSGVDGAEGDTPEAVAASAPTDVRLRSKRGKRVKPYEGLTGQIVVLHEDLIRDAFWSQRPWLLM